MGEFRRVLVGVKGSRPKRWRRGWQRIAYPTATHYSPHFTKRELDCRCGCKTPRKIRVELGKLARDLELMRDILGPMKILGGYRCPKHNRAVNGAVNSQHLYGKAADLGVPQGQKLRYVAAANSVPAFHGGGIGVYPNGGVHVDRRGFVARWNSWVGQRK